MPRSHIAKSNELQRIQIRTSIFTVISQRLHNDSISAFLSTVIRVVISTFVSSFRISLSSKYLKLGISPTDSTLSISDLSGKKVFVFNCLALFAFHHNYQQKVYHQCISSVSKSVILHFGSICAFLEFFYLKNFY